MPYSKLQGIFTDRNFIYFLIRSLTPQQAAGDALAFAVQRGTLNLEPRILFVPDCQDKQMKSSSLIKPYLKENRLLILTGLISLIIVDVLQLLIPRVIKWSVDDLTTYQINLTGLLKYAFYLAGIGLLIGVFRYFWRHCLLGTSRRVEEGLRNELFSHIQTLSASYFDKVKTGDLMAHATNDIQQVRMATGMGMVALNDAIVLGAAAIGFMAYINIKLTLFCTYPGTLYSIGHQNFQ